MMVLIVVLLGLIFYLLWLENYWKRRGLYGIKGDLVLSNIRKFIFGKKPFPCAVLDRYKVLKELKVKHGGIFSYIKPTYIPMDLNIIKLILQTDASHFLGRGLYHTPADVLSMNLLNLDGDKWKLLRAKLSPTFTLGKIKMMFPILVEKSTIMADVIGKSTDTDELCDVKDVLSRYTVDIIGSCAFGIECNSLKNPNNDFSNYGKKIFERKRLALLFQQLIPWKVLGYLGYKGEGRDVTQFFSKLVEKMIDHRETNNIRRTDFLQIMLDMKTDSGLTLEEMTAQAYIFFIAGFETSSNAMMYALLELARNPEIQEKLRSEIRDVLSNYDDQLCYESVQDMSYLDKVVKETLRLHPAIAAIPRVCTKDYKIPGTSLVIEKGVRVQIPLWGIHLDPEYYPEPHLFYPENFSEENKTNRRDCTFMPFGEGPRICIGMKFGLLQVKIGLITVLRQFSFAINERTTFPLTIKKGGTLINVNEDIWFNIKRI